MAVHELSSKAIIGRYYATIADTVRESWVDAVSTPFDSNEESETYKFLGQVAAMREWEGGRQARQLMTKGMTITNVHYEQTLEIPTVDIRRDKTGQIMVRVDDMAVRYHQHWESLMTTLIENGTSTDCYDGQFFFDTDHSEDDSGTQNNDVTSSEVAALDVTTATTPTATEMEGAILSVITHMLTFKDNAGEPMNATARKFLVMCPPTTIYSSAVGAVKNVVINNNSNTLQNMGIEVNVACNPRLTWTDSFAIFRTDSPVKPLIRQTEYDSGLESVAEGSELAFNDKIWRFGRDCYRACGYGYWQYACYATMD